MKRFAVLTGILVLLLCVLPAARAERQPIPAVLKFTQTTMPRENVRSQLYIQRTYPHTSNAQVNEEMRALIDEMTEAGRPFLPTGKIELMPAYLDVGANIFRTGSRWMSFLTIARIAYEREQTYVSFDARVYDMESGKRLSLKDLFDPDSAAWEQMAQAVREQLTYYWEGETPDAGALDTLCSREALENAAFTLTPAKIELHYRADALYPGKQTLMHVKLYDSVYRPLMNAQGQQITDNSMYKMIALTYDDGGARGYSMNLMNELRRFGANGTFFVVGTMMEKNHDVLCRQNDGGYAVASHNYEHVYSGLTPENIFAWKAAFDREMNAVIGWRPQYMRAPGGHFPPFIKAEVGMPLIQWSAISGDANGGEVEAIAKTAINVSRDGGVLLMHDLQPRIAEYNALLLDYLERHSFLCVTVDELFDHYGVPLEPNQVYYGCEDEAKSR